MIISAIIWITEGSWLKSKKAEITAKTEVNEDNGNTIMNLPSCKAFVKKNKPKKLKLQIKTEKIHSRIPFWNNEENEKKTLLLKISNWGINKKNDGI